MCGITQTRGTNPFHALRTWDQARGEQVVSILGIKNNIDEEPAVVMYSKKYAEGDRVETTEPAKVEYSKEYATGDIV